MSSVITNQETITEDKKGQQNYKQYKITILWNLVFYFAFLHAVSLYGIYLCFISTNWKTLLFAFVYARIALLTGIAAVHRMWCHRAFKAKLPLRIFLCITAFALGQENILHWCRDHRVHHKHTETDADPYNSKRGFFFSHIGWMMCKKHSAVIAAGKKLPMDDLLADPVVRFNVKYYYPMWLLFCFIFPTVIPVYFWDEKWLNAFCVAGVLRYVYQLHCTWYINSFAHMFGYRPFDKKMEARDSPFSDYIIPNEGSHNFHHAFPRDYKAKEHLFSLNSGRVFIELMALIGQSYDLKLSSDEVIKSRKLRTGDGSK